MSKDWMKGSKSGCHTGNPVVFEAMGVKVHAGGHSRNGGWHRMKPAPDLAMGPAQVMTKLQRTEVPTGFSCADHVGGGTHVISMDWPDFDIPQDVHRAWWLALVDDIRRLGIETVSTQCVGGHGRTGVQLAILAHLMGAVKKPDAAQLITWVRDAYCSHAVETHAQQAYVAEVCDLPEGESLFPVKKASKVNIEFDDSAPDWGARDWGDSIFAVPEFKDDEEELAVPKKFNVYGCAGCGLIQWQHDDDKRVCSRCASPELTAAGELLFATDFECFTCTHMVTPLALPEGSQSCTTCIAEEQSVKGRKGDVQCTGCKRYYIPECVTVLGKGKSQCVACERKAKQPKAKQPKARKPSDRRPVPKGGLRGTSLKDFIGMED